MQGLNNKGEEVQGLNGKEIVGCGLGTHSCVRLTSRT